MAALFRRFTTVPEAPVLLFKTTQPFALRFVRVLSFTLLLEPTFIFIPALLAYDVGTVSITELVSYMMVNSCIFGGFYVRCRQAVVRGATKHTAYAIWYKPKTAMLEVHRVGVLGFLRRKQINPTDLVPYNTRFNPLLSHRSKSLRGFKLGTNHCGKWNDKELFDRLVSGRS